MNNYSKAKRKTVKFCDGVEVDGYLLPDGSFRVGKVGASLAVGYGSRWVGQLKGKPLEVLQGNGYTGGEKVVSLDSINGGGTTAKTLSLKDFRELIKYAAITGKKKPAQALLNALLDVGIEDWFRLSFDIDQLTLQEKREKFYQTYAQTINWLDEDKRDWRAIAEQEQFVFS